jgi:hypothetical protein
VSSFSDPDDIRSHSHSHAVRHVIDVIGECRCERSPERRRFSLQYWLQRCTILSYRPPLSTNAFGFRGSSFLFSSLARSSVAAHKILAVFMKSNSFATCMPTPIRRPNPYSAYVTWPSRFVSLGQGQDIALDNSHIRYLGIYGPSPLILAARIYCPTSSPVPNPTSQ